MGRKRKDAPLAAPIAGRKRRRPEHVSGHWASLPSDIVQLVSDRFLDGGDIADYVHFRAVCSYWRACTESMDLRAESWIALCDGDAVWPEDAREIALFHTRTARRLRVRLPKLRGYMIIGFSTGLLVLMRKSSAEIRVLHPFTCVAVDFPSLAPVFREVIRDMTSFRGMRASLCRAGSSPSSIAVVLWFPYTEVVVAAEADSDRWDILHRGLVIRDTVVFQGRLYATKMSMTKGSSYDIVQLFPPTQPRPTLPGPPAVVARVPDSFGHPASIHLAESDGTMLLVVRHHAAAHANSAAKRWPQRFTIYAADLNTNNDGDRRWNFTPVSSLGDRALFLGNNGCLSVSARDLPSINRNSIYFSDNIVHPVVMHSLTTGLSEDPTAECRIHDRKERTRPSVRPFTIADHLLTFCHPHEWTKGLMFHKYHVIPQSFTDLRKRIHAKESQQRLFRRATTPSTDSSSTNLQKAAESIGETAKLLATELERAGHAATSLAESCRMLKDSLTGLVSMMKQQKPQGNNNLELSTVVESNKDEMASDAAATSGSNQH